MTPVQFSLALLGLGAGIFNSLPAATAPSLDRYFVAPLGSVSAPGAFTPFQVKASDSLEVEYLNLFYYSPTPNLPCVRLSPDPGLAGRGVGCFMSSRDRYLADVTWLPAISPNDISRHPDVYVYLHTEMGVEQNGDVKLRVDTVNYCDAFSLCYPSAKTFTASRSAPQRMSTLDGNQIEILRVDIRQDNAPWASYFFGYGMGAIAEYSSFNAPLAVPFFRPISLPPPKAEGTVVEYVNTADFPNAPGGHYFYSADSAEQATVDAGAVGKFVRTGHDFAAGGFVPVCRFYGSLSPGPNSHFFTVSQNECDYLKSLQASPTPSTGQQWNYEGTGLYSVAPVINAQGQLQCLSGSVPVYRAYNNAYPKGGGKNAWDSNHRYSTRSADIDNLVAQGWVAEGIALCAPVAMP